MPKRLTLVIIVLLLSVMGCSGSTKLQDRPEPQAQSAVAAFPPPGYTLAWQDIFATFSSENWSKGLESDISSAHIIWNPTTGGPGLLNDSYAGYIAAEDVYVENGLLVLRNQKRSYSGQHPAGQFAYTSGWVNSMNKRTLNGTQRGTYVEIKAQFPSGLKVWPAIWLVTEEPKWPPEIDIWEYFGHYWNGDDKMYMRYIYPKTETEAWLKGNHDDESQVIDHFDQVYDCEAWHTYGFQWTSSAMVWSIDGDVVHTLERSLIPDYWPDEAFALVINNGVQTNAKDEDTTWPNYLILDYIAVYEEPSE
jgi:beta-glucanase (GH16 family)